ncbi:MAG: hypothetical protein M3O32_07670 [Actinomycetota bacterium]|nr:hypothetical protein [Actinomycetota bacterium]MDP9165925.1 hypothetical protein [Actinomycetota bacterium]
MRLEPGDEAIVLMTIRGVEKSRTMVYEDGIWNMQATDDFASHLSEPVDQIIQKRRPPGSARSDYTRGQ